MKERKHSCTGKMLVQADNRTATCYECGRTIPFSPIPIDVGGASAIADIKGHGLRSVRRSQP